MNAPKSRQELADELYNSAAILGESIGDVIDLAWIVDNDDERVPLVILRILKGIRTAQDNIKDVRRAMDEEMRAAGVEVAS